LYFPKIKNDRDENEIENDFQLGESLGLLLLLVKGQSCVRSRFFLSQKGANQVVKTDVNAGPESLQRACFLGGHSISHKPLLSQRSRWPNLILRKGEVLHE
jgi:hypothetical protein